MPQTELAGLEATVLRVLGDEPLRGEFRANLRRMDAAGQFGKLVRPDELGVAEAEHVALLVDQPVPHARRRGRAADDRRASLAGAGLEEVGTGGEHPAIGGDDPATTAGARYEADRSGDAAGLQLGRDLLEESGLVLDELEQGRARALGAVPELVRPQLVARPVGVNSRRPPI